MSRNNLRSPEPPRASRAHCAIRNAISLSSANAAAKSRVISLPRDAPILKNKSTQAFAVDLRAFIPLAVRAP